MDTYTSPIPSILIVATNPLARMGLAALLTEHPALHIIAQSAGVTLGVEIDQHQPDVLIWDWGWGETPERLLDAHERPVLALVADAAHGAEAWNAGVRGLLPREAGADVIAAAAVAVAGGLIVLHPSLAGAVQTTPALAAMPALTESLTTRESEVLQLLAEGLPNKMIARQLDITEHTVKFHVNAIMSKLNAQSRTEAVVRATRLGLIML